MLPSVFLARVLTPRSHSRLQNTSSAHGSGHPTFPLHGDATGLSAKTNALFDAAAASGAGVQIGLISSLSVARYSVNVDALRAGEAAAQACVLALRASNQAYSVTVFFRSLGIRRLLQTSWGLQAVASVGKTAKVLERSARLTSDGGGSAHASRGIDVNEMLDKCNQNVVHGDVDLHRLLEGLAAALTPIIRPNSEVAAALVGRPPVGAASRGQLVIGPPGAKLSIDIAGLSVNVATYAIREHDRDIEAVARFMAEHLVNGERQLVSNIVGRLTAATLSDTCPHGTDRARCTHVLCSALATAVGQLAYAIRGALGGDFGTLLSWFAHGAGLLLQQPSLGGAGRTPAAGRVREEAVVLPAQDGPLFWASVQGLRAAAEFASIKRGRTADLPPRLSVGIASRVPELIRCAIQEVRLTEAGDVLKEFALADIRAAVGQLAALKVFHTGVTNPGRRPLRSYVDKLRSASGFVSVDRAEGAGFDVYAFLPWVPALLESVLLSVWKSEATDNVLGDIECMVPGHLLSSNAVQALLCGADYRLAPYVALLHRAMVAQRLRAAAVDSSPSATAGRTAKRKRAAPTGLPNMSTEGGATRVDICSRADVAAFLRGPPHLTALVWDAVVGCYSLSPSDLEDGERADRATLRRAIHVTAGWPFWGSRHSRPRVCAPIGAIGGPLLDASMADDRGADDGPQAAATPAASELADRAMVQLGADLNSGEHLVLADAQALEEAVQELAGQVRAGEELGVVRGRIAALAAELPVVTSSGNAALGDVSVLAAQLLALDVWRAVRPSPRRMEAMFPSSAASLRGLVTMSKDEFLRMPGDLHELFEGGHSRCVVSSVGAALMAETHDEIVAASVLTALLGCRGVREDLLRALEQAPPLQLGHQDRHRLDLALLTADLFHGQLAEGGNPLHLPFIATGGRMRDMQSGAAGDLATIFGRFRDLLATGTGGGPAVKVAELSATDLFGRELPSVDGVLTEVDQDAVRTALEGNVTLGDRVVVFVFPRVEVELQIGGEGSARVLKQVPVTVRPPQRLEMADGMRLELVGAVSAVTGRGTGHA